MQQQQQLPHRRQVRRRREGERGRRELTAFFDEHAAEVDAREGGFEDTPSAKQRELGDKYGFAWSGLLYWGTEALAGDQPDVILDDEVLIVLHTYCGGGLGETSTFLERRGATVVEEDSRDVQMSLLFRAKPGDNAKLDAELAAIAEQIEDGEGEVEPLEAPWADNEAYGTAAWFRDPAGTVGLSFPVDPRDIAAVRSWLADHQIDKPVVQIEVKGELQTFAAIAAARCRSCEGALEYLDPRLHDIETPQLVCKPCGGLYELSAFITSGAAT